VADALELIGGVLIVVGVALYAFPLALIVTGLFLVAAAWSLTPLKGPDPAAIRGRARPGR
jgi:ABC-type microcin C transport system permease subunit YejB